MVMVGLSLFSVSCKDLAVDAANLGLPVPDFSLDCPGVTEHAAHVDTFLVIGHRGSPTKEVENTIPSYKRALDDGANAIELDICMTSDGHIVIWHDWNPDDAIALAREQGGESGMKVRPRFPPIGSDLRRPVDELTLAQFRENYWYATKDLLNKERVDAEIPTLEQFLEWGAQEPRLFYVFFDVKLPATKSDLAQSMIATADSIIRSYSPKFSPVYMTPNPSVWGVFQQLVQGAGLSFDVDLGGGLVDGQACDISSSHYARQRGSGFATTMHPFVWTDKPWGTLKRLLACDLETRDTPVDSGAQKIVSKVIAATINDKEKMECLVDMGVDGLMTDDPALLRWIAINRGRQL